MSTEEILYRFFAGFGPLFLYAGAALVWGRRVKREAQQMRWQRQRQ